MTHIAKWKPIWLLCVDYKIITKALTNRLLPTLNEIISIEQSAAVPNGTIYNNLFTIRDIMEYSNKKKYQHIYLLILCTDYKILAKIWAHCLKQILLDIISLEQNCTMWEWTIFNNLFLIRDLIKYAKKKKNTFLPMTNWPGKSFRQNR